MIRGWFEIGNWADLAKISNTFLKAIFHCLLKMFYRWNEIWYILWYGIIYLCNIFVDYKVMIVFVHRMMKTKRTTHNVAWILNLAHCDNSLKSYDMLLRNHACVNCPRSGWGESPRLVFWFCSIQGTYLKMKISDNS